MAKSGRDKSLDKDSSLVITDKIIFLRNIYCMQSFKSKSENLLWTRPLPLQIFQETHSLIHPRWSLRSLP